jgi:hypothetical protein
MEARQAYAAGRRWRLIPKARCRPGSIQDCRLQTTGQIRVASGAHDRSTHAIPMPHVIVEKMRHLHGIAYTGVSNRLNQEQVAAIRKANLDLFFWPEQRGG